MIREGYADMLLCEVSDAEHAISQVEPPVNWVNIIVRGSMIERFASENLIRVNGTSNGRLHVVWEQPD